MDRADTRTANSLLVSALGVNDPKKAVELMKHLSD
jgi:hypothetical protein